MLPSMYLFVKGGFEVQRTGKGFLKMLLTEDPNQRLGARGASDVKQHPFFRDINWDTLARQKDTFVPALGNALDLSYFMSRFSWNPPDERVYAAGKVEDSSGSGSVSGSSSCLSNCHDKLVLIPIANGSEEIEAVTLIDILRRTKVNVVVALVEKSAQVLASSGTRSSWMNIWRNLLFTGSLAEAGVNKETLLKNWPSLAWI